MKIEIPDQIQAHFAGAEQDSILDLTTMEEHAREALVKFLLGYGWAQSGADSYASVSMGSDPTDEQRERTIAARREKLAEKRGKFLNGEVPDGTPGRGSSRRMAEWIKIARGIVANLAHKKPAQVGNTWDKIAKEAEAFSIDPDKLKAEAQRQADQAANILETIGA